MSHNENPAPKNPPARGLRKPTAGKRGLLSPKVKRLGPSRPQVPGVQLVIVPHPLGEYRLLRTTFRQSFGKRATASEEERERGSWG